MGWSTSCVWDAKYQLDNSVGDLSCSTYRNLLGKPGTALNVHAHGSKLEKDRNGRKE